MRIESFGHQSYLHSLGQLQGRVVGVPYLHPPATQAPEYTIEWRVHQNSGVITLVPELCPEVTLQPTLLAVYDLQPVLCPTVTQLPDKSCNSFQLGPHALKRGHRDLKPDAGPILPTLCPEITTQDPQIPQQVWQQEPI